MSGGQEVQLVPELSEWQDDRKHVHGALCHDRPTRTCQQNVKKKDQTWIKR